MPIIPVDQKFHTLDPTTPTPERGSTRTNSMHEIYTMQDIIDTVAGGGEIDFIELGDTPSSYPLGSAGQVVIVNSGEDGLEFGSAGSAGSTFDAVLSSSLTYGMPVYIFGYDAVQDLPIVRGSGNDSLDISRTIGVVDQIQNGVVAPLNAGDIVTVTVSGVVKQARVDLVSGGATPSIGSIAYLQDFYVGSFEWNTIPIGRYLEVPATFPGNASLLVDMPEVNAYYEDLTSISDGFRSRVAFYNTTIDKFDIVKIDPTSASNITTTITRWGVDPTDTVGDILGVNISFSATAGGGGLISTAAYAGEFVISPASTIPGPSTVVAGDILYSDVTTPYQLTTDPASGIQIAIVREVKIVGPYDECTAELTIGRGSGGGATTGEKLDFTVRSSAYTGATGEHEGIDLKLGGAASVTAGLAYYWDGNWNASDAVLPASGDGLMAMATDTGVGVNMMQKGIIQLAANPAGAVAGSVLYFESGTPGTLTATAPSASGNIVRVAGHAIDAAGLVYFDPSEDWLEIV